MKKHLFLFLLFAMSGIVFTSCDKDEPVNPIVDPVYNSTGLFVLNEGNQINKINGSLSFIDYKTSTIGDGLFAAANKRSLGGTPNDMVEVKGRLYICVTDENRVEVVDAVTMQSIAFVSVKQPREICASKNGVYVSSYDGTVSFINFDGKLVKKSEVIGSCLEGITMRNEYVYVCNAYTPGTPSYTYHTNVVKLNANTLKKETDIAVASNPTKIECNNGNMYVLSSGNYADVKSQIQVIDDKDNVSYLCDATMMAVVGDDVYAINSVTDWATYVTTTEYFLYNGVTKTKKPLLNDNDAKAIVSPCGIAVDPISKYLFISSYNLGATGFTDYSARGYVVAFTLDGTILKKYDAGVGPRTMVPFVKVVHSL